MDIADTPTALLIVAIQDLFDAERAWSERLPALREMIADRDFDAFAANQLETAACQSERLVGIAEQLQAPVSAAPNIWLRAILDDAERDTRSVAPGTLLDIALVGAFRKGIQSERVSYETAVALAEAVGANDIAATLTAIRAEEAQADATLAALLSTLAGMLTA